MPAAGRKLFRFSDKNEVWAGDQGDSPMGDLKSFSGPKDMSPHSLGTPQAKLQFVLKFICVGVFVRYFVK